MLPRQNSAELVLISGALDTLDVRNRSAALRSPAAKALERIETEPGRFPTLMLPNRLMTVVAAKSTAAGFETGL
jgi:hypothetical protein